MISQPNCGSITSERPAQLLSYVMQQDLWWQLQCHAQVGKSEEPGQPRVHNPVWLLSLATLSKKGCIVLFVSVTKKLYRQSCAICTCVHDVFVLPCTKYHVVCGQGTTKEAAFSLSRLTNGTGSIPMSSGANELCHSLM